VRYLAEHLLPDNFVRQEIAAQVAATRLYDANNDYHNSRNGRDYIRALDGMSGYLEYVSRLPTKRILDIGAGTTRAAAELEKMTGIPFWATVLVDREEIERYLGRDKTYFTSVEYLSGIPDNSCGGALGVYSVAYSSAPRYAVGAIDRVLAPGGIFKGTFAPPHMNYHSNIGLRGAYPFIQAFDEAGFVVGSGSDKSPFTVVVAMKPPLMGITPKDILKQDLKEIDTLLDQYRETVGNYLR
jgi:SAM-dependent methyltransferase